MRQRIVWSAVIAVLLGAAGTALAAFKSEHSVVGLCLVGYGIIFASLAARERQ